ncbi:hypothetical protein JCM10207_006069 [Rhodosporidiobolus poonsookiae]
MAAAETSRASSPALDQPADDGGDPSLLNRLQRGQPTSVHVQDLSIQAPVPRVVIPLAVPIVVPQMISQRMRKGDPPVPKSLVRGVTVDIVPGEVLAIIGGSGSGKTTLLNTLAGRTGDLELSNGSVNYQSSSSASESSSKLSLKQAKKRIGYVRQTDDLLPNLTVRETLTFAAALRLPRTVSSEMRKAIVEQTIMELGLAEAADVIVGGAFRKGISGGERRRLSIGCVLVTMPSVLVLDEPTTGLDSFTAFQLLETLQRLARRGRTVLLSIHQPRSDAFHIFDKIILLSQGSVVYSGLRTDLLPHFASLNHRPPEHTNPLDFVIDISSVDNRSDEAEEESSNRVGELVRAWRECEARRADGKAAAPGGPAPTAASPDPSPAHSHDPEKGFSAAASSSEPSAAEDDLPIKRANLLQQTLLLTHRGLINVSRDYGKIAGFFLQAVVIGVVLGLVFLDIPETPAGVQSLKTVLYFLVPAYFYMSIVIAVFLLCQELVIFDRETEDNLYSTIPWVLSAILIYLPFNVVFPTLYSIIVYFMTGLRRDSLAKNLFSVIAQCLLQQQGSWSYALIAVGINRSYAQASLLANGFTIPFVLSAGYILTSIPGYLRWTQYISPYFYGFHWVARLQFVGRTFACEGVTGPSLSQCDGTQVLVGLRFNLNTPLWVYPVGLTAFVLVTYVLGTLLLAFHHPGGIKHSAQQEPSAKELAKREAAAAAAKEAAREAAREKEQAGTAESERERVDVAVDNLCLVVRRRGFGSGRDKAEKVILEDVTARFPAGQVSVIMGPSGAGKSSLLQILAGRLSAGAFSDFSSTGAITLNGSLFDSSLASLVAFVQQEDDHHLPALTVRETLRYAARLRLKDRSSSECDSRAEEVLRMLGLKACADNMVGGELVKGISGGEKRRLSLAVELLSDPAVLYADEPLSGLDAFTAQNVMQTLRDLATAGRTVVVSVHQPRSDIWRLFDNVLLLVKGGFTAYSGPTDGILKTFEASGQKCPEDFNPADFILDVVSVDHRSTEAEKRTSKRVSRIVDSWAAAPTPQAVGAGKKDEPAQPARAQKLRTTPFVKAFPTVLSRSFKNLRRQSDIFVARVSNPPFLALLFWLYFLRLGYGPSTSQDRIGLLQETTALPFVGMLACIAIFPSEKQLFFHEYKTSARHSPTAFLLAYSLQETVVSLISSLLWSIIFIYGMNMQGSGTAFVCFWIGSWALISAGESIGIMFSTFTNNGGLAVSIVSASLSMLAQLNGIISVTMDYYLRVIGWISPMKPQAAVALINEMVGLEFRCTDAEIASGACIYTTGEQVLETFGLPAGDIGKYMGILIALVVIWRLFAWTALQVRVAYL